MPLARLTIFNRRHNKDRNMQTTPGAIRRGDRSRTAMLAALLVASTLSACGGGGGSAPAGTVAASQATQNEATRRADDNPASSAATAPTLASVLVRGPVSALGSLTVNSIRYDDRNATVRINNRERRLDDLRLGMMVEVEASRDDATAVSVARSIKASSFAEGRIDAIDRALRTISVMGVVIKVPSTTVFEGWSGLDDPLLKTGDLVEVHGFAGTTGGATATRIERKEAAAPGLEDISLSGAVTGLNTVLKTFVLSRTTVAYGGAKLDNIGAGLAEGMAVRVEGIPSGPALIIASEINGTMRAVADVEGFRVQQEGYVSDFVAPARFKVNGMTVDAADATVLGPISNNVLVQVEGVIRNGVLIASSVQTREPGNGRVGGQADKFAGVVAGTTAASFQISGFIVRWDASTRFDGVSAAGIRNGMRLEVEAVWTGNEYLATRIRQDD